jgi:hypothetical protein
MTTTSEQIESGGPEKRRAKIESPEQALIRIDQEDHELIASEDWTEVVEGFSLGTLKLAAIRWCQLSHRRVLSTESPKPREDRDADRPFQAYLDLMWAHYRKKTGAAARAEAGLLVAIFAAVKPRQLVEEAMTRAEFGERYTKGA